MVCQHNTNWSSNTLIPKVLESNRNHQRRNFRGSCQWSQWSQVRWLQCSSSYYFGGRHETQFIDFIGMEGFDVIIDSYLVNIVNCMKIRGQEVQVAQ